MGNLLKTVGNLAHGVKDAMEHSAQVREQVKALGDVEFIQLARRLNIDYRRGATTSIMLSDLAEVEKFIEEITICD